MNYDFNKREDTEYSHSYDYLSGVGLGRSEVQAELDRRAKLGTYDLDPVGPPSDAGEVVKIANLIIGNKERESLVKKIGEVKDKRLEFVWNDNHVNHKYFKWALHCIDRQVKDWQQIRPGQKKQVKPSAAYSSVPIEVGNTVQIENIKARRELNGKVGIVVREENDPAVPRIELVVKEE